MPLAIECGMSLKEFWEEDCDLLFAYQKAYINKIHKQSHIQGMYNNLAFATIISNMFKDKNKDAMQYPQYDVFNPFSNAEQQIKEKNKKLLNSIDVSKNNNGIYQIKKMLRERRND